MVLLFGPPCRELCYRRLNPVALQMWTNVRNAWSCDNSEAATELLHKTA